MDFYEIVRKRRMVRNFTGDPVDPAAIERILDAAKHGPSAGFTQGQDFIVVTDPQMKVRIAKLCGEAKYVKGGFDPFISKGAVLLVPCTSERAYHLRYQQPDKVNADGTEIDWPVPYWFVDMGHAMMLVLLAVVAEGLAASYAGFFGDLDDARAALGIPPEVTPLGAISIGHPAPDKRSRSLKRGRRADYIHREKW